MVDEKKDAPKEVHDEFKAKLDEYIKQLHKRLEQHHKDNKHD